MSEVPLFQSWAHSKLADVNDFCSPRYVDIAMLTNAGCVHMLTNDFVQADC